MNIQPGYDPEKKCITLSVDLYLISRYFPNFSGMIKGSPDVPEGTEVEQVSDTVAVITFPIDDKSVGVANINPDSRMMSIGINAKHMDAFQKIISSFVSCAISKEIKTTEFIPLYGYSISNLKEEVQEAVKNKRKLCIIKDYSEYTSMNSERKYVFHQYMVEPGTRDYTEAAILLYNEDIKKLREIFEDKLKLESWC